MPGGRLRCRTGSPGNRTCGSTRSRPHGQPQQKGPHALREPRALALESLDPEIEPSPPTRELLADPRRQAELRRRLRARTERELPAPHTEADGGRRRSELGADGPVERVVGVETRTRPGTPRDG